MSYYTKDLRQAAQLLGIPLYDHIIIGLDSCFSFTDGTQRDVDLEPYLRGPIFEPIRNNPTMFRSVKVDKRMGTIVWENRADIDPDVLYHGLNPAWLETNEESERKDEEHKVVV